MAQKPYFHIFDVFSETASDDSSYNARRFRKPRPFLLTKIIVKLYLQAFWQNFEYGKCKNVVSVYETFKNLLLQNYSTEFLHIAHKCSLGKCN